MNFQEFLLAGNNNRMQQNAQNIFSGFSAQLLSQAFGISQQTSQRIQSQNDQRGDIIRVHQGLQFLKPIVTQQEQQQEVLRPFQSIQYQEKSTQFPGGQSTEYLGGQSTQQAGQSPYVEGQTSLQEGQFPQYKTEQSSQYQDEDEPSMTGGYNGLEENFCSLKARQNIENPSRSDTYNPRAGRITRLNSQNFPILNLVQMSATRVNLYQVNLILHFDVVIVLYITSKHKTNGMTYNRRLLLQNAILSPFWNMNAHSVVYMIQGHARVQVVNNHGQTVFNDRLRQGQLLVIPQHYVVLKKAEREGCQYISFKTNSNSMVSHIAGKNSILRALPVDVIANAYRISRQEARNLKNNRGQEFGAFTPKFNQPSFQSFQNDDMKSSSVEKA
jgi:hypothetical protein